jgi:hypothetical protein
VTRKRTAAERSADLAVLSVRLSDAGDAFRSYYRARRRHKEARAAGSLPERVAYYDAKRQAYLRQCRIAFSLLQRCLQSLDERYPDDGVGEAVRSIKSQIDSWNLNEVKSRDAAEWMAAFLERVARLQSIGPNLNNSQRRQNQIRKIAAEPFSSALAPASRNS